MGMRAGARKFRAWHAILLLCFLGTGTAHADAAVASAKQQPSAGKRTDRGATRSLKSTRKSDWGPSSDQSVTEVRGISVRGTDEYPKVFNIVPWQTPTLTRRARPKLKPDLKHLLNPVDPKVLERQRTFRNSLHLVNPEQGIE